MDIQDGKSCGSRGDEPLRVQLQAVGGAQGELLHATGRFGVVGMLGDDDAIVRAVPPVETRVPAKKPDLTGPGTEGDLPPRRTGADAGAEVQRKPRQRSTFGPTDPDNPVFESAQQPVFGGRERGLRDRPFLPPPSRILTPLIHDAGRAAFVGLYVQREPPAVRRPRKATESLPSHAPVQERDDRPVVASAAYPYQMDPFRRAGLAQILAMERDPGRVRGPVRKPVARIGGVRQPAYLAGCDRAVIDVRRTFVRNPLRGPSMRGERQMPPVGRPLAEAGLILGIAEDEP